MTNHLSTGVCTWTFGDLSLADIAARLARLGFDGVELKGDLDLYQAQEAAQILADHGLQVLSLTPGDVDLAHPDPAVRAEAIDYHLRLLDFAAALGQPLVSCHGLVGRIRPVSSYAEERAVFVEAMQAVAERAQELGLRLVMEVLNRYEAHLNLTAAETLGFVAAAGADNMGLLLDAYHMNIEEADPAAAIRQAGDRLWLYHVADSNRAGIGYGHIDFAAQFAALEDIGYSGPVIMECTASGPDPFTPVKGEGWLAQLETYLHDSRQWLALAGK